MKRHIGLFLNKKYISSLSRDEYAILMQQIRIINSLEFWLRMQISVIKEESKNLETRNSVELMFNLISVFNECIKEYTNELSKKILLGNIPIEIKDEINGYVLRYTDYKTNRFLLISNIIRNKIMYHVRSDFLKPMIKEGDANDDLLLGAGLSEKRHDFCFVAHYTLIFELISNELPNNVSKHSFLEWITNEAVIEIDSFIDHLYRVTMSQIKGNGYKKYLEEDYTI